MTNQMSTFSSRAAAANNLKKEKEGTNEAKRK
jgi:hypothetical protein